ncbi:MAG: hypothetical protein H0X65_17325 [Gemmatimonadetes bacterium]|nr:hypothetical protein [Gemmatimonadota bacterium]
MRNFLLLLGAIAVILYLSAQSYDFFSGDPRRVEKAAVRTVVFIGLITSIGVISLAFVVKSRVVAILGTLALVSIDLLSSLVAPIRSAPWLVRGLPTLLISIVGVFAIIFWMAGKDEFRRLIRRL